MEICSRCKNNKIWPKCIVAENIVTEYLYEELIITECDSLELITSDKD